MSKIEKELKHLGKAVSMAETERVSMRENLNAYTQFHTTQPTDTDSLGKTKSSSLSPLQNILTNKFVPAFLIALLIIGSGATVAKASEEALPGDRLYPIKEFVEEVHAKALLSNEAKASWATIRIARRVKEVRKLKIRKRLTTKQREFLSKKINSITARTAVRLTILDKKNPARAKQIRNQLKNHSIEFRSIVNPAMQKLDKKVGYTDRPQKTPTKPPLTTIITQKPVQILKPVQKAHAVNRKIITKKALPVKRTPHKPLKKVVRNPIKKHPTTRAIVVNSTNTHPAVDTTTSNALSTTSTASTTPTTTQEYLLNKIKRVIRKIKHSQKTHRSRAPKPIQQIPPTQASPSSDTTNTPAL